MPGPGRDAFIASYSAIDGAFNWARALGSPEVLPIDPENPKYEIGTDLDVDAIGNVYLTGVFDGIIDFDRSNGSPFDSFVSVNDSTNKPSRDIFVVSYGQTGTYRWGFALGGPGEDQGQALVLDGNGNFALAGIFSDSCDMNPSGQTEFIYARGETDVFLAHYQAANGVMDWARAWGGVMEDMITPGSLEIRPSGDWITGGWFDGIMDADAGGSTADLTSNGGKDMFIAAYSASGEYQWAWSVGGANDDQVLDIKSDADGEIFIGGSAMGQLDVDPGVGTDILNTNSAGSASDIFLGKYDVNGSYLWANLLGGSVSDSVEMQLAYGLAIDTTGSAYLVGQFYGSSDFNPAADLVELESTGKGEGFVAKYDPRGNLWAPATAIESQLKQELIQVWPNPFGNEINIEFSFTNTTIMKMEIFDPQGKKILEHTWNPSALPTANLSFPSELARGMYVLKISTEKGYWSGRIVKL